MDNISYHDLSQLYNGCLCLYKKEPVKVLEIDINHKMLIRSLEYGKTMTVAFSFENFSPPLGRIGFINHNNLAFYATRRPMRQWALGVKPGNIRLIAPDLAVVVKHPIMSTQKEILKFELKTVSDTLKNNYPSFVEALKSAIANKGVYAFDKQFAVDYERNIYYKSKCVGKLPRGFNLNNVVFTEGNDYLLLPLIQHYEKTVRVFGDQ